MPYADVDTGEIRYHPWELDGSGEVLGASPPPLSTPDALPGLVNGRADDTLSQITREEYADYVSRIHPLEDRLIDMFRNPNIAGAVQASRQRVGAAYDASAANTQRRIAGLGMTMTGQEQGELARQNALSRTAATVNAGNVTRRAVRDRQDMIMTGGLSAGR